MIAAILSLLAKLLPMFFGNKGADLAELADSNARAQEQLASAETANEVEVKANTARNDAADRVLRIVTDGTSPTDAAVKAKLKQQFPDEFRD